MTDSEPVRPLSPIVRAAIALHRRPGGYVALLGAGISKPTGVKSAWEILATLISRAAAAQGATPEDPFSWWKTRHHAEAVYGDVLEAVASTPAERRGVLAEFFEQSTSDVDDGLKAPSAAHRELAQLVARGYIRIVLTLNFDHLMERALREAGIEPTVVASPAGIAAMEPLHAQQCVVVHLHGEYRSPELLNTPGELAAYSPATERLLEQIADEYGLLVVGWSATWDTRLVELLATLDSPRFSTWWVEPGDLTDAQRSLGMMRWAEFIDLPADDAVAQIGAALDAVTHDATKSTPLNVDIGAAAIKRELRRGGLAVDAHDLVRRAISELADSTTVRPATYDLQPGVSIADRAERVLTEIRPAAAFVTTIAYWGDETNDRWWFDDLERLSEWPGASGNSDLLDLARSPSVALLYAAGAAAVASERWPLVFRLLVEPQTDNPFRSTREPLISHLTPAICDGSRDSLRLARFVGGLLHRYLDVGTALAVDAWERFEYLAILTSMDAGFLPWYPWIRVSGSAQGRRALPAVWLDNHLGVIQPFLNTMRWLDGADVTRRRAAFDAAFAEYAQSADLHMRRSGQIGRLPTGRHYPGQHTDRLDLDRF